MKIVLVHGWGCHSGVWYKLAQLLAGHELFYIDLGFVRGGPRASNEMPANSLCIGHSFGAMWLLKHGPRPMKGLVSIAGFDCLHKHVPHEVLAEMRRGMLEDAQGQIEKFWDSIGIGEDRPEGDIDAGGLRGGLDWIARWDAGEQLKSLNAPILALAAENDRIVRKEAVEAIWGDGVAELHWHKTGGHMLQLTEPEWCARQILKFADALEP